MTCIDANSARGGFNGRYARAKAEEKNSPHYEGIRLLDCLLSVAASDDPDYLLSPAIGEFAVIDVVTKEKAWFEMPHGCTPEIVTSMIQSCFNANAQRVANKLWFV